MKPSNHPAIRALLTRHPSGLTAHQVAAKLDKDYEVIRQAMRQCFGVYVDHWTEATYGSWSAVWKIVKVPKNATNPKPRRK